MTSARPRRNVFLAALATLALLAAACTSSAETATPPATVTSTATAVPASTQTPDATAVPDSTGVPDPTAVPDLTAVPDPTFTTAPEATPPASDDPQSGISLAQPGQVTLWSGVIDNSIEVTLELEQHGSFVGGWITYAAEPILVLGRAFASGGWFFHEFGPDGRNSGTFSFESVADGAVTGGMWGTLEMDMEFVGTADGASLFTPSTQAGEYRYLFGPYPEDENCCGPQGFMQISNVTSDAMTVHFNNTRGGPSYNLAYLDPTEIPLNENVGFYESSDGQFINCAFEVEVFDGFAYVHYVDERWECGFGQGAAVEAIYVLTQAA